MMDHSREIHRSKTSSRAFLLSKTDASPPAGAPCSRSDENAAWAIETLSKGFPEVIKPSQLTDAVASRLEAAARFAGMLIRIDDFNVVVDPEGILTDLAAAVAQTLHGKNGFWGICDQHMLAAFVPECDNASAMALAEAIRDNLAQKRKATVSIGIAAFPTLGYDKPQIIENAQKALDHAEFFGPDSRVAFDSVSLNISGDKYYQAGDVNGAVAEFQLALKLDPENVNVLNSIGVCYGIREELDKALASFEEAIRLDPAEILPIYNAGYVHMLKGDYATALEHFERANGIDENVFELAFQTGRVYLETKEPDKARKHFESAVRLNDKSGAAFRYLGDCYAAADRDSDAITAYKNCLKLRPDDAEALSALGYLYEMQERNADIALLFCNRASELNPENGLFHHRLGRILYNRNRLEEALAAFEAAHEKGCDSAEYIQKTQKMMMAENEGHRIEGT